ncbi:VanZ family protein [Lacticaseibacillus thailandensis DSM 22698 = JCM 13996]|uniref:VanZ family protein n=2 Tax=Lacticaseibacillus thailandensis TaxID=381741 RepID=A0A0R2CAE1_9LACO|nr:VanZ family protein [Lacticaseibacillus thailandensis DSM 22698 = JCM 13996]
MDLVWPDNLATLGRRQIVFGGKSMRTFWGGVRRNGWLVLALFVLLMLFISSSMTFHQQNAAPLLARLLPSKPGYHLVAAIHWHYAGSVVSVASEGYFGVLQFIMRKCAHFGSYFILGLSLYMGTRRHIPAWWLRVVMVPLTCAGCAALDEFHQMLTGDRSPLFQDVILDTTGAVCGMLLVIVLLLACRRRRALN